ncbi:MAG: hypothetical protein F6K23_34905 [Okeania sp. SIO2C9]|uniref:hypothetical protein n=1 Tax=Okeania sp. SIO2C9 TaxID=2607791 RepID=UPI0013C13F96|nr:hypothetical protein [Okeania sp. SIO2C9]NEQ77748.1 hypothetical protein [Okeania sp. SIO2C9]
MGRWGDGEMGRWGDGEMGRWKKLWVGKNLMHPLSFNLEFRIITAGRKLAEGE